MSRQFDVIVLGSTGVVGKLVCEHLANHYQGKIRWAMAARNMQKMEHLRSEISKKHSGIRNVPLLVGDATDQGSLERITGQAKVILALNGPYAKLGTPVVKSCLSTGTHYCDITGEVQWVKQIAEQYHAEATRKGVKIVHSCGFDSIPSDLGTLWMADHIQRTTGRSAKGVEMQFLTGGGGIGGGTIVSLLGVFESPNSELKAIRDPYCLDPQGSSRGSDQPDYILPHYSKATNKWTSFFVMAPVNTRIVRRTQALLGNPNGKDFSYRESQQVPNVFPEALLHLLTRGRGARLGQNFQQELAKETDVCHHANK